MTQNMAFVFDLLGCCHPPSDRHASCFVCLHEPTSRVADAWDAVFSSAGVKLAVAGS